MKNNTKQELARATQNTKQHNTIRRKIRAKCKTTQHKRKIKDTKSFLPTKF
jgi:hypothetical protein